MGGSSTGLGHLLGSGPGGGRQSSSTQSPWRWHFDTGLGERSLSNLTLAGASLFEDFDDPNTEHQTRVDWLVLDFWRRLSLVSWWSGCLSPEKGYIYHMKLVLRLSSQLHIDCVAELFFLFPSACYSGAYSTETWCFASSFISLTSVKRYSNLWPDQESSLLIFCTMENCSKVLASLNPGQFESLTLVFRPQQPNVI